MVVKKHSHPTALPTVFAIIPHIYLIWKSNSLQDHQTLGDAICLVIIIINKIYTKFVPHNYNSAM